MSAGGPLSSSSPCWPNSDWLMGLLFFGGGWSVAGKPWCFSFVDLLQRVHTCTMPWGEIGLAPGGGLCCSMNG